ncbi:hypothetical protein ACKWTF_008877 [Chironomus riparius]
MFKLLSILTLYIFQTNCMESSANIESLNFNPVVTNYPAFIKLGTFRGLTDNGSEYQKSYYFPIHFRTNWGIAKSLCSSFGLELATMETRAEADSFLDIVEFHQTIRSLGLVWILIDGITSVPRSTTEWFWTKSGNKISFMLPWNPGQPDFYNNRELCLTVGKGNPSHRFGFNDWPCWDTATPFICQKIDFVMH